MFKIQSEVGLGLPFINALRRAYPKDPRVTQEEYFGWLSYLNTFMKAIKQSGQEMMGLPRDQTLSDSLFPPNYFVKSPNPTEDRYLFKVQYDTVNPETNQVRPFSMSVWLPDLGPLGNVLNTLGEFVQQFIDVISTSARAAIRYYLRPGSFTITSVLRRF